MSVQNLHLAVPLPETFYFLTDIFVHALVLCFFVIITQALVHMHKSVVYEFAHSFQVENFMRD